MAAARAAGELHMGVSESVGVDKEVVIHGLLSDGLVPDSWCRTSKCAAVSTMSITLLPFMRRPCSG